MDLLERASHLQELDELLQRAAAGSGSMAIVGGEAGSGKTSLIHQFASRPGAASRAMIGACDALSTPRPLGPLFDVASSLGPLVRRLLRDHERRTELFSAVLDDLSGSEPTLFVIEDVHWADEATLDLLRFLGRRIDQTRTLLAVTYRNDEAPSRHPLQIVLGDLATLKPVRRISLPLLSQKAVAILCEGTPLDPRELHRRTGGNPFYVTEVIASNTNDIPATVRGAVLTRAARLSPAGREALDVAGVIGDRVEPWLLEAVVSDAAAAVDECLAVGLLRIVDARLHFRHQLAQQAVLDEISPIRASQLHVRVLGALRSRPSSGSDLATLAHHAEAAGDTAAGACGLGAHREAAAQYARALRFAGELSTDERTPLLDRWINECYVTGQFADALVATGELLAFARSTNDRLHEAHWLTWRSQFLVHDGKNAQAEEACTSALEILESVPPEPAHAAAYVLQAHLRMLNRDHALAIEWGERVVPVEHA